MKNKLIAEIFRDIAQILEIKGENHFRIRAYERAGQNIDSFPDDVELLAKENKLKDIPGVGKDLEEKMREIISTGRLKYLDELKKEIPEGLLQMLDVPGIGPKTAKVLYEKLDIQDIVMLERMAAAGKIRELPGMGEKTEENILAGIDIVKKGRERLDLKTAMDIAESFVSKLEKIKEVKKAGSQFYTKRKLPDFCVFGLLSAQYLHY